MLTDIARLTLRECARLLSYKDKRSARRWCINHAVAIFSDVGAKTPYVLKTEFEAARLHSLIPYLKNRYGVDWKLALTAYQFGDISGIETMLQDTKKKVTIPKVAAGKNASRFFSELMQTISATQA